MMQAAASDFTSNNGKAFCGFGFFNHCPFFDPTDVEEDTRKTKLGTYFAKSIDVVNNELTTAGDKKRTVQDVAMALMRSIIV